MSKNVKNVKKCHENAKWKKNRCFLKCGKMYQKEKVKKNVKKKKKIQKKYRRVKHVKK